MAGSGTHGSALRGALAASRTAIGLARRRAPVQFILALALLLGLAIMPALQVHAVSWLVRGMVAGNHGVTQLLRGPIPVTAAVATGSMTFLAWSQQAKLRLNHHLQTVAHDDLNHTCATRSPRDLALAETTAELQEARDAVTALASLPGYLIDVLGAIVTAVTLAAAIWTLSPGAAVLVALALVPTMATYLALARIRQASTRDLAEHQRRANYHTENLTYQRPLTELSALGTAGRIAGLADRERRAIEENWRRYLLRCALCEGLNAVATLALLGAAITLLVTGHQGGIAAGGVLGVVSGIAATRGAGHAIGQILVTSPQVGAYRAIVSSPPAITPMAIGAADRLDARGITVTYEGRVQPALRGVDISLRRGELVALVGSNGAGKTTLVNALMGLVPASSGGLRIDGIEREAMDESAWLGHFGLLTQEFGRHELTIRENLLLGLPQGDASDDALWAALTAAQADGFVRELPDGLDTQLGQQWGGVGISGGQWQRLALARIHLRSPGIWILDEPTSAIDAESEMQIFDELSRNRQDRITLVVSHRAVTLRRMDRIHVLDGGVVVETGRHDELLARRGRFWQIFREQAAASG